MSRSRKIVCAAAVVAVAGLICLVATGAKAPSDVERVRQLRAVGWRVSEEVAPSGMVCLVFYDRRGAERCSATRVESYGMAKTVGECIDACERIEMDEAQMRGFR